MLIRRLQQRDERAFAEVMRLYQHKVYNLVYRMIGSRSEAEDIAQEVFVTVFKTVDSFRGEAKFSTWLLRIAANHSKNRIKYLARRPTDARGLDDAVAAKANELLDKFPGSPLRVQALSLLTQLAWEQRRYRTAAENALFRRPG